MPPSSEALSILAEVRANLAKLRGCPRHLFNKHDVRLGARVTCENCGGKMEVSSMGEYIAGYQAAGGDPNDIMPGYTGNGG